MEKKTDLSYSNSNIFFLWCVNWCKIEKLRIGKLKFSSFPQNSHFSILANNFSLILWENIVMSNIWIFLIFFISEKIMYIFGKNVSWIFHEFLSFYKLLWPINLMLHSYCCCCWTRGLTCSNMFWLWYIKKLDDEQKRYE